MKYKLAEQLEATALCHKLPVVQPSYALLSPRHSPIPPSETLSYIFRAKSLEFRTLDHSCCLYLVDIAFPIQRLLYSSLDHDSQERHELC